jgi:hypothetical protein
MSRKIQFVFLLLVLLSTATQSAFAQADPPLNFGNNFFVTGDYVVAGAYGMNSHLNGGFATGTISIPDANPGIRGTPGIDPKVDSRLTVPQGANIIAALLYWQTVEKVGNLGTGQNGFFRPVFMGGPTTGYPITGENLPSHSAVSFSNGGCSGTSTGKIVQTYRADVRGFLPLDANGNALVDSADNVTFEVRLPSVGAQTPLTLGATLVLIYRVVSPNFPLSAITIYDGAFAPNTTPNFTMSEPILGLGQAGLPDQPGKPPVSRLTHIVGAGLSNKFQAASLSGGTVLNGQRAPVALPSPYGVGQPAFPGFYGRWDNTTWIFPDPQLNILANPLHENDDSATATVVASGANPGCVSWGAVIVSTTLHDDDKDGILPVWKNNINPGPGYTDFATGLFVSLADPDPLNQPKVGQQDIFIQMDHVVDVNGDFTPDPTAVNMVKSAFANHNIHLHITDASQTTKITGGDFPNANIIQEPALTDGSANCNGGLCAYPNQPGITTWRYGFEFVKNQPINYPDETSCENAPLTGISGLDSGPCVRRFPIAQRNSHHYVVFGDTLGADNWTFFAGKLTDSTDSTSPGSGMVSQAASTVTFYTTKGHGLTTDNTKPNGRITVSNAITNPKLNGTFFVTFVHCPPNLDQPGHDCDVTNKAEGPYIFQIIIPGSATANYIRQTDPYLAVASGQASSGSGLSDIGGMGTLVTLGKWGANATLSAKAGTLMHELGHTLGLSLHGGSYYDHVLGPNDYRPRIEANCKPNYQSVMSYLFQARLVGSNGVLDFSSQQLNLLNETSLGPITTMDNSNIAIPGTSWYDTTQTFAVVPIAASPGGATESGSLVTITTTSAHGLVAGQSVTLSGVGGGYDGTFTVFSVPNLTQFTYNAGVSGLPPSGGGIAKKPIGTAATHHCDDTPLNSADPQMFFYQGGTTSLNEIIVPWSSLSSLDVNFDGTTPGAFGSEPPSLTGYNDWANVDPRQVGGTGSSLLGPGGLLNGGPGGLFGGPGGLFGGPGGLFGGPGGLFGGPGGLFGGPGGLFGGPGGLFGGPGELDFANALSSGTPAPTALTAFEGPQPATGLTSPRTITLTWAEPKFPATDKNNIYRDSHDGNGFVLIKTVSGVQPAGSQNSFVDTVNCNPNGYSYFVTTLVLNTTLNPPSDQESTPSSTVSFGQGNQLLTGCYTPPVFLSPVAGSRPLQGSVVPITWTLQDASNSSGTVANNPASNTLVAIGPISNDVVCVPAVVPPNAPRSIISSGGAGITFGVAGPNQFSFRWNTAGRFNGNPAAVFPPGCYLLEDDLDSGQPMRTFALTAAMTASGGKTTYIGTFLPTIPGNTLVSISGFLNAGNNGQFTVVSSTSTQLIVTNGNGLAELNNAATATAAFGGQPALAFQRQVYLSDVNESVVVHTTSVPDATVGIAYSQQLQLEPLMSGVAPVTWTLAPGSGPLPAGILLDPASGTLSGTPTTAGKSPFTVQATDSIGDFGTQALTLTVHIFVSDAAPPPFTAVTALPNGVVGSPYSNTVYESGGVSDGVHPFTWTVVPGSVMPGGGLTVPGLLFQLNALGVFNGTLSGTPTAPGAYTFTAMVTDSAGNTGTQTLTLNVADALFGDLVVVDGSPSANPLAGTLFRITPDGTVAATIASIANGSPTAVAVDANTGSIYVAVALGTPRIVKVTQFGAVSDFVPGGALTSPVAVAVDASGNVYVGDNNKDLIYKFNSSGTQVDASGNLTANPFASLPASPTDLQDIRMAFDSGGNLIVATDAIGDTSGVIEVDKITPAGVLSVVYNTLTNSTLTDSLTAASGASGQTTYTGTFFPVLPANSLVTISGFTNPGNDGQFTIVSCTSTQLVVNNPNGVAETNPGTATFNPAGLSPAIETVGGIAVLANGSIDVADFGAKSIFNIANPGAQNMAITTAVNGPAIGGAALCCNISGMANPPSQINTTLYLTVNGSAVLQLAVPETSSVNTVRGAPLTFPNDVTWYSKH